MKHDPKDRERQLIRAIPDITKFKTVLYIGANLKRMEMVELMHSHGMKIDVLEIWPRNYESLRLWNKTNGRFRDVVCGDIRELNRPDAYDVVMWWHGPEHVSKSDLPNALNRCETAARSIVVVACPCGRVDQADAYGNPYETHANHIYPADLRDHGYRINIFGKTDREGSNLIGWKRRRI